MESTGPHTESTDFSPGSGVQTKNQGSDPRGDKNTQMNPSLEANFSTLLLSVASSAAVSLGLSPDPKTNQTQVDKKMAKFNIDLLEVLKKKSENNRSKEESQLLDQLIGDLKTRYIST